MSKERIRAEYELETGKSAIYKYGGSSCYIRWLENRLEKAESPEPTANKPQAKMEVSAGHEAMGD